MESIAPHSRRDLIRRVGLVAGGAVNLSAFSVVATPATAGAEESAQRRYAFGTVDGVVDASVRVTVTDPGNQPVLTAGDEVLTPYTSLIPGTPGLKVILWLQENGSFVAEPLFRVQDGTLEALGQYELNLAGFKPFQIHAYSTFVARIAPYVVPLRDVPESDLVGREVRVSYVGGESAVPRLLAGVSLI